MDSINKIRLNGVEYAITDQQAQQIAALLSNRIDIIETATSSRIDTLETATASRVQELRDENQQLKDELDSFGWAYESDDGTIQFE